MPAPGIIEVCPGCGRANRIPFARLLEHARCGSCGHAIHDPAAPVEVNGEQLAQLLASSPVPVVVDFWADWCGPCRALAPQLDQASRKLGGSIVVAKVNVDQNPDVASRYGAQAIPLLVMFARGRAVWRATGLRSAAQLEREIRAALPAGASSDRAARPML
jgi:thioredoxin 2